MTVDPPRSAPSRCSSTAAGSVAVAVETFAVTNPPPATPSSTAPRGGRADAERAVEPRQRGRARLGPPVGFRPGRAWSASPRSSTRRDELARALTADQGKPLRAEAYDEVDELVAYWRMAAADATRLDGLMPPSIDPHKRILVQRVPRGVVGVITPWNWPYTMAAELLAPALAGGNTVVWNPARHTSLCSVRLAECIVDADLPPGVFNLVTGPGVTVGDEIAGHALTAAVGFVGSTRTGQGIARRAAGKELLLELGGNGPLVVMDDADLDAAVEATLAACYLNAGQSCTAGERILVHRRVHDRFLAALQEAVAAHIRMGDPLDDATTMGPLNNEATAAKTDHHVADAVAGGAARGGRGPASARTWAARSSSSPTILDGVTEGMAIAREETFGPVAPVTAIERPRRGSRHRQRVVLRPALGYLHAGPAARAALRRGGPQRLGQHQRGHQLLGVAPALRRPRRLDERPGAGRRPLLPGAPDRAQDHRRQPGLSGRGRPHRPAGGKLAHGVPDRANVVVIGAGIVGNSMAYHLARLGLAGHRAARQGPPARTPAARPATPRTSSS